MKLNKLDRTDLINKLLEIGLKSEGQSAQAEVVPSTVLKELVNNLKTKVTGKQVADVSSYFSSGSGQPVSLNVENLRNFGDFIRWLAENQIQYKGTLLSISAATQKTAPGTNWLLIDAMTFDRARTDQSQPVKDTFWVNKSTIKEALAAFRDTAAREGNPVFKAMIGKSIESFNTEARLTGNQVLQPKVSIEDEDNKKSEQDLLSESDDYVIDAFNVTQIDQKNFEKDGLDVVMKSALEDKPALLNAFAHKVTLKDISDEGAFNSFINASGLTPKVPFNASTPELERIDMWRCQVYQNFYLRALYLSKQIIGSSNNPSLAAAAKGVKMYLSFMEKIIRNQSHCPIPTTQITGLSATQQNNPQNQQGQQAQQNPSSTQQNGSGKSADVGLLNKTFSANVPKPLSLNVIDFTSISNFSNILKQIGLGQYAQMIDASLSNVYSQLPKIGVLGDDEIDLRGIFGYNSLSNFFNSVYAKGQTGKSTSSSLNKQYFQPLIISLDELVQIISKTLRAIQRMAGRNISGALSEYINSQIGETGFDTDKPAGQNRLLMGQISRSLNDFAARSEKPV